MFLHWGFFIIFAKTFNMAKAKILREFTDKYNGKKYPKNSVQEFEHDRFKELEARKYIEPVKEEKKPTKTKDIFND